MSRLIALPLVPAACVLAALAVLASVLEQPLAALLLGLAIGCAAAVLAAASADRPRRLMWAALAGSAVVFCVRLSLGPISFDLRHISLLDGLRDALAAPLARLLPEPEAGLVLGIVLGERASIGPELMAAFNATGTTHLLAISGFNLTLVSSAVAAMTRRWLGPLRATVLAVAAVLGYSVIVGLQPSVLRALLMAAVGAVAVTIGRRGAAANALAAAVLIMLALDLSAVGSAGALLSVGATAGLILWQRRIAARLAFLPSLIGEGLAATLAATLPTLPLIAGLFGRISLVAPFANLVAVPLFTPILAFGALTSAVGAVSPEAAAAPAFLTWVCTTLLRHTVELGASVPGASLEVPLGAITGGVLAILVSAAIAVASLGSRMGIGSRIAAIANAATGWWRRMRAARPASGPIGATPAPRLAVAIAGGLVLLTAIVVLPFARMPPVRVTALDIGQGDAYLVQIDGRTALIDGGPDPTRLLAELGASLPPWQRRIDLIALTHAHLDHGAGLLAVLDRYDVGLALEPEGLNAGPLRDAWAARLARTGTPRRAVHAGERVRLGGTTIAVLSPNDNARVDVPSLVLRLERGGFSMLFMGDATDPAIEDLLLSPATLPSRVYVPPHHGAATPFGSALVGAVHPDAAVLSVGAGNRYGHPTPETLMALAHIVTYRTDRDGSVALESDGASLGIHTHANALAPPHPGIVPHAPPAR